MIEDFGKILAEYLVLSSGGTNVERRESTVIEDSDIIQMQTGDCFLKLSTGEMFKFHFY